MTPACQYLSDATDVLVEEFTALIARRFAADRSISVVECPDGRWVAQTDDGSLLFPPCPYRDTVERFARAFAVKERVRFAGVIAAQHSVRANVVPIRTPA